LKQGNQGRCTLISKLKLRTGMNRDRKRTVQNNRNPELEIIFG